ncbi:MAG: glycosyltransferase family 4 protein [Anaerolineales bacterium]|nr:glycosyltransferase family 4 protein [Anaerolineales bacterium]
MKPLCLFIAISWHESVISHYYRALAEQLVNQGHQVILLFGSQKKWLETSQGNPLRFTWPSPRPTSVQDALFLYNLIRSYQPDGMIASFVSTNLMMPIGWVTGVPCRIAWYHTLKAQTDLDPIPQWKHKYLYMRKRAVFSAATHVIANSESALQDVHEAFHVPENKCHIFYFSMTDPLEKPDLRSPSEKKGDIICVGRLIPAKGQEILIRALALLKHIPEIRVEFLGDGWYKDAYQELAKELGVDDRCTFSGAVPHTEVLAKMASAGMTVLPSRSEAFGIVNIESMAVGTPVIASNVGGIPEVVRDGQAGFLVPPEDPEALAEKIELLLSDNELRERMGQNARERFLEKFKLQRNIGQHAQLIEDLVRSKL